MNTLRTLTLAIVLTLPAAGATLAADPLISSVGTNAVGQWLRDPNGTIIGSVRSLSGDGRTANVMIGSYFEPGSHEAQVPVSLLSIADGKVILQRETLQALNVQHR